MRRAMLERALFRGVSLSPSRRPVFSHLETRRFASALRSGRPSIPTPSSPSSINPPAIVLLLQSPRDTSYVSLAPRAYFSRPASSWNREYLASPALRSTDSRRTSCFGDPELRAPWTFAFGFRPSERGRAALKELTTAS